MLKDLTQKNSTIGMQINFRKTSPVVKTTSKKMWLFSTTRIIPYLLLLLVLAGIFGMGKGVEATNHEEGVCTYLKVVPDGKGNFPKIEVKENSTKKVCEDLSLYKSWVKGADVALTTKEPPTPPDTTGLGNNLPDCMKYYLIPNIPGCLVQISYFLLNVLPSFLLGHSAMFFNAIVALTLSNKMINGSTFIPSAWAVVRDLSNIFFILILLYVGIQTILGISDHAKKMVVQVIIMALLINFSMFFTKIIIDTSNVIALIFYNKINTETTVDGKKNTYLPATNTGIEKDISGGMVNAFNPGKLLSKEFFDDAKAKSNAIPTSMLSKAGMGFVTFGVAGLLFAFIPMQEVPISLLLGMIVISGAIILFATYAFFIAGISFLGRLIELWLLIIFSPFAFMSSAIPKLAGIEYIGWESWLKRLIEVSFMAPIFMFFLYFIFRLINANIFSGLMREGPSSTLETVLFVIIPALFILILLLKATDFAKKGGGKFAEMAIGAMKVGAVLAVGAATGGTALAGRAVIGTGTAMASRSKGAVSYGKAKMEHNAKLDTWNAGGKVGSAPTWKDSRKAYTSRTGEKIGMLGEFGGKINESQARSGKIDHARHELDDAKKKAGFENVEKLSGFQENQIEDKFIKDNRSQITSDARQGEIIVGGNGVRAAKGEDDYKRQRRSTLERIVKTEEPANQDSSGKLTKIGEQALENKLTSEFNEILRNAAERIGKEKFEHLKDEAKQKVGVVTRLASNMTSGTYDVRNITEVKTDKREGLGARVGLGIIAAIATGMKVGLSKGTGVDIGTGQGKYWKDIGQTISDALKNVKLDVKFEGGGGHEVKHGPAANAHAPSGDHH